MADDENCERDCYDDSVRDVESCGPSVSCQDQDCGGPTAAERQGRHEFSITTENDLYRRYLCPRPIERPDLRGVDLLGRGLIALSPFVAIATSGPDGCDCWLKGGARGFVEVYDHQTLLVPDRFEDGYLAGLRNIVLNPAVGLTFLVPGMNETVRVHGRATVSADPMLLNRFPTDDAPIRSVIVVRVERAHIHSGQASLRAALWNPDRHLPREGLPSLDDMIRAQREEAETRGPKSE